MNAIYNHANKQIGTIRKDLNTFESNLTTSPLSLQGSIAASLTQLSKTVDEYENFSKNELDETKAEKARARVATFRQDITEARKKFQGLKSRKEELTQEANKSELMRRHTGQPAANDNPFEGSSTAGSGMKYGEGLYKEKETLQRGNQMLDDILGMAHSSYDELVNSNATVRQMQQQLNGVLGTLGVSQETIRNIERVARTDKFIFYLGAFILFVSLYFIYRWIG